MAFGDVSETLEVAEQWDDGIITGTYAVATPATDDLNVCVGYSSETQACSTSGFVKDLDSTDGQLEVNCWRQNVTGTGDDTITINDSGAESSLAMVFSLIRGAFESSPVDLTYEGSQSSANPVASGVSGSATSQASEVFVGGFTTFGDAATGNWARQGTATPTSNMTQVGYVAASTLHPHLAVQVLTATGTVGISRANPNSDDATLIYASYKAAGTAGVEIFRRRIEGY